MLMMDIQENERQSVGAIYFRDSIHNIRKSIPAYSQETTEINNEKRWRPSYLKEQFDSFQLHNLFQLYTRKVNQSYFSQYLSLQIVIFLLHIAAVLYYNILDTEPVLPDLIIYGSIIIFSLATLLLTDFYVKKYPKLLNYCTVLAFLVLFCTNVFIPYYHSQNFPSGHFRPAYSTHLIISCYIFLNVRSDLVALILGIFVSVIHIILLIFTAYENTSMLWRRLFSDTIFLVCVNGLGVYFRYFNEIVKRRSFLDRRACVESTFQLNFEKEQEDELMSSIIPKHIIDTVRSDIMKYVHLVEKNKEYPRQKPFDDPYVEEHDNVSILFGDIVNFTSMTTKLNIVQLLETLNELFGRFDYESEKLKVVRIKFLGDCYYCVAGLPPDNDINHAEACVDMGLKMISIIGEVRRQRDLDISMRIGVHSGSITSGIIGVVKWQYDIWSNDADIANKMETEGCAGQVHITEQTLNLLQKSYNTIPTTKGDTVPQFIQNNIKTYLITPDEEDETDSSFQNGDTNSQQNNHVDETKPKESIFRKSVFINSERRYSTIPSPGVRKRPITERRSTKDMRRTAFMNNNIKRYEKRLMMINEKLEKNIENMMISKRDQWFKVSELSPLFMVFRNFDHEMKFIQMPDPLFRYYLMCEIILIFIVFIIENLTLPQWDWSSWSFYISFGVIVAFFIPLTWTHFLWTRCISKYNYDNPDKIFLKFFHKTSTFITKNFLTRFLIYTVVCALFTVCVFTEMVDCEFFEQNGAQIKRQSFLVLMVRSFTTPEENQAVHCVIPWHMTETCGLAVIMSFVFIRMYIWIKLTYAIAITAVYAYFITRFSDDFYERSETYNYLVLPQTSHILSIVSLTITLHFIDRQTEYLNRLEFLWNETLIDEQREAEQVKKINKMLLINILPIHVAELYLDVSKEKRGSGDLYHEQHPSVAVMFASLVNYCTEDMGKNFLKVMNRIICEFDNLSVSTGFGFPIEKIKIAKWTYMAACGLDYDEESYEVDRGKHQVIAIVKFAAALIRELLKINRETVQNFELRVGIGYGPVAAGVVGSKKPLYDIWGDAVNMASRMDTTGLPNKIQVLGNTAKILEEFDYKCLYRGLTVVKGKSAPLETFFVELDDDFYLVTR